MPVLEGVIMVPVPSYEGPQVLQLEAPQLLQELPVPATRVDSPASFLEKEAQAEIIRSPFL